MPTQTEFVPTERIKHIHIMIDRDEWLAMKRHLLTKDQKLTTWARTVLCAELKRASAAKPTK